MALTKDQKIKKLNELGVELTGDEKVKDLDALLKTYSPATDAVGTPIDELEEASEVVNKTQVDNAGKTRTVVRYINPDIGLTDREFTLESHGEDFQALAKQFAEKFNGIIDP